jgi:hypothetical protein
VEARGGVGGTRRRWGRRCRAIWRISTRVSRVGFIGDSLEEVGREGISGVSAVRRRCWRGDTVSLIGGSREEGFREVALALFVVVSWSRSSYFSRSLYIVG